MLTSARILEWLKRSTPFLICVLFIVMSLWPSVAVTQIPFTYIIIFYFALFHASLLSDWACFLLGVITDLTVQSPFGMTPFLYVLLFFMANLNRLFLINLSFQKLWLSFSVSLFFLFVVRFFLFSLCSGTVVGIGTLFVHYVFLVLFYPPIIKLCGRLDHWIQEPV